ncbi:MAG: hypothetical protein PQJ60_02090 [Spirochaetales bacterium]|nr:hypothetical protein [Spirochaetales bacterium]
MKKILVLALLSALTLPVMAQSLYFDIGFGLGSTITEMDGTDVADYYSGWDEASVDLSMKLGFGPLASGPFYLVAEVAAVGHRFEYDSYYRQFNSYLLGPGVVFYPVPFLQLAGSAGYSWTGNDFSSGTPYESEGGYAFNASAALDLGKKNNGFLLGGKYSYTFNTLETSGTEQVSSQFSLFGKYVYRTKMSSF